MSQMKKLIPTSDSQERVTERDRLGYYFECQKHCATVFEVKGMTDPADIELTASEFRAAKEKKHDYVLVCVYNLPNHPDKVGCRIIPNPLPICFPVERARIPRDKLLEA